MDHAITSITEPVKGEEAMTEEWRVEVDRGRCMGTGACEYTAGHVFRLGSDGVAMVVGPVEGTDEAVRDAIAECPVAALRFTKTGRCSDGL